MSEPIRTVTYQVTPDGITPAAPQPAGVQGEHRATQITFQLDAQLQQSGYRYRAEFTDSAGDFDTTAFLPLEGGSVTVEMPRGWTRHAGVGEVRLCIAQLDDQGGEEQTVYTFAGRVQLSPRTEGMLLSYPEEGGLSGLVEETQDAADAANTAALNAQNAADTAGVVSAQAQAAADTALQAAAQVQGKLDRGELTGPKGDPGAPGAAATVAVGTVTTGAAGSGAAVTNAGTASAAVFNFTIPRGDKGETGAAGAQGAPGPNEVSESTATALSGLLKGDGTKVTTAAAGTDYATPEQLSGKLDKTGGTVSGALNVSGTLTVSTGTLYANGGIGLPNKNVILKTTAGGLTTGAVSGTDYTPGTPTSTTIKLTFSNGDTVNLKAYKFGRLVMLPESVWVDKGNVTEGKVGTIPTGYRPTANFTLCPPSNLGYGGYIQFRTNGDIYIGQLMGGVRFAGFICNINYVVP